MHDDQYTATGPAHHSSAVKKTAYSNHRSDFLCGVSVEGNRCGVVGVAVGMDPDAPDGVSNLPGIGVEGRGPGAGVVGIGRDQAIASVFGQANRCRVGVLGVTMDREDGPRVGIAGISVRNMGNPLDEYRDVDGPADGRGTGVLGVSGTGAGVAGKSDAGPGVAGTAGSGPGVRGQSDGGEGGRFSSRRGVGIRAESSTHCGAWLGSAPGAAQLHLEAHKQTGGAPALPKSGNVGDLILIRNQNTIGGAVSYDSVSLWLCVPGTGLVTGVAQWQEVPLGQVVAGTV